jgi:hypothetical protein
MAITLDGTLGITSPAETVQGALTTTGNTILGDATTDTLNVGAGGLVKDASGNVGIGTASPNQKLSVFDSTNTLTYQMAVGVSSSFCYNIGRNPSNALLTFYGTQSGGTGYAFGGVDGERMRIDSSGNLLVGTTTNADGVRGNFEANSNNNIIRAANSAATGNVYCGYFQYSGQAPNNTVSQFITCNDTGATRAVIRANGGLANFSANNVNLSDRREKTNFTPATSYLDKICAIPVQTFNYIDQNMEEDGGLTLGVVAQDVQDVAPEMVMESNWGTEEEPKMRLSIYQTDLQYALMKCIQEQQALITQLQADVATLKALSA